MLLWGMMAIFSSSLVTWAFAGSQFTEEKAMGIAIALLSFTPPFIYLLLAWRGSQFEGVLKAIVGGLFFKLAIILFSIWAVWKWTNWDFKEMAVTCVIFIIGFQIWEALIFATGKKTREVKEESILG
ncbi:MAG: hypothetical protein ACK4OO_06720 [bacterium]